MTSSNGHHGYDEDLLASAPAPTKGMVQSGYATDLLVDKPKPSRRNDIEAGRHRSHSSRHAPIPNGAGATVDAKGASNISIPTKTSTKIPFYRTKRGIVILIIVAIVLLAAIIGGAVGGALANKNKNNKENPVQAAGGNSDVSAVTDGGVSRLSENPIPGGTVTIRKTTTIEDSPVASPRTSLVLSPPGPPVSSPLGSPPGVSISIPTSFSFG